MSDTHELLARTGLLGDVPSMIEVAALGLDAGAEEQVLVAIAEVARIRRGGSAAAGARRAAQVAGANIAADAMADTLGAAV